ncbi:MAG: hypothetical protein P8J55_10000 [Pseudomonadales bacterium]|nr:hypothetical protein [Pseudomonadales bacterium]
MSDYLSAEQFADAQANIAKGNATLTVPRATARQFFTRVSNQDIKSKTGQTVLGKKLLIWTGIILEPLLLLACFTNVGFAFGWAAYLAIPMIGIFWTIFAGYTSEHGSWLSLFIILVITAANMTMMEPAYSLSLFLFTLSLWIHRLTYVVAQAFLNNIVIDSFSAYDMLAEHVVIEMQDDR